jgi:hypothetical protein
MTQPREAIPFMARTQQDDVDDSGEDERLGIQKGSDRGSAFWGRSAPFLLTAAVLLGVIVSTVALVKLIYRPKRKASFLVLGDWGWDQNIHGDISSRACQQGIADAMHKTFHSLGDVRFVINVGDSFYPGGVYGKNDPQWDTKWRNVYSKELRSVQWYSVYGNHDYHKDPCACSGNYPGVCAQVSGETDSTEFFYMPNYTYFKELPDLGLEVIGLDLNNYVDGWNRNVPIEDFRLTDCQYTPCPWACKGTAKLRSDESFKLLYDRARTSTAPNWIVFSHYPTDYFWAHNVFVGQLRNNSRHHIEYFAGHRHNVDQQTLSISPNNNWLVGGGGGWGCEEYSQQHGFVVGEIGTDRRLTTRSVLVDPAVCCR